jgi:hypothetical protein
MSQKRHTLRPLARQDRRPFRGAQGRPKKERRNRGFVMHRAPQPALGHRGAVSLSERRESQRDVRERRKNTDAPSPPRHNARPARNPTSARMRNDQPDSRHSRVIPSIYPAARRTTGGPCVAFPYSHACMQRAVVAVVVVDLAAPGETAGCDPAKSAAQHHATNERKQNDLNPTHTHKPHRGTATRWREGDASTTTYEEKRADRCRR